MIDGPSGEAPLQPPSRARARCVLAVLFVVYVFNFIDRQILGMLLPTPALASRYGPGAIRWSLLAVVLSGGFAAIFYRQASRHLAADLRSVIAARKELTECAN